MDHYATAQDRRIAVLKREGDTKSAHAMQLFSSMLWAFKGTTRSSWKIASANDADVVVFHAEDSDDASEWQANGKLAVIITTDLMSGPATRHALVYPFKAAQVFELLEQLDAELRLVEQASAQRKGVFLSCDGCWAFSDALRAVRARHDKPESWFAASRDVDPILWVKACGGGYFARSHDISGIRNGTVSLRGLTLEPAAAPPAGAVLRPQVELSWFAAWHADNGPIGGMSATARHRVVRWPDFGSIRPPTSQMRAMAVLAADYVDRDGLAARARIPAVEATRTLNALAVHGLLTSCETEVSQATTSSGGIELSSGALRGLLGKIRRRLGLGG